MERNKESWPKYLPLGGKYPYKGEYSGQNLLFFPNQKKIQSLFFSVFAVFFCGRIFAEMDIYQEKWENARLIAEKQISS